MLALLARLPERLLTVNMYIYRYRYTVGRRCIYSIYTTAGVSHDILRPSEPGHIPHFTPTFAFSHVIFPIEPQHHSDPSFPSFDCLALLDHWIVRFCRSVVFSSFQPSELCAVVPVSLVTRRGNAQQQQLQKKSFWFDWQNLFFSVKFEICCF